MAQSDDEDSTAEPTSKRARAGRNLPLAIGSAVLFAVLFLASALVSKWALLAFIALILVIGVLEVDAALRTTTARPPTALVLVAGLAMLAIAGLRRIMLTLMTRRSSAADDVKPKSSHSLNMRVLSASTSPHTVSMPRCFASSSR